MKRGFILKIGLLLFCLLLSIASLVFVYGIGLLPHVQYTGNDFRQLYTHPEAGERYGMLNHCNFDEGDWDVYLLLNYNDGWMHDSMSSGVYHTSDVALMKQMQQAWQFECRGADIATIFSSMLFIKDGVLMYETHVQIAGFGDAFQNPHCGAAQADDPDIIKRYAKQMQPVYWPVVFAGW